MYLSNSIPRENTGPTGENSLGGSGSNLRQAYLCVGIKPFMLIVSQITHVFFILFYVYVYVTRALTYNERASTNYDR